MANKIKIKRGAAEDLPALDVGELGYTTDTNKLYVGGSNGNVLINDDSQVIQYSTIPTAISSLEGDIIQYIGTTNQNATNGYFYKCVSDGAASPTYSWQQVDVQPSGDSNIIDLGSYFLYEDLPSGGTTIDYDKEITVERGTALFNTLINTFGMSTNSDHDAEVFARKNTKLKIALKFNSRTGEINTVVFPVVHEFISDCGSSFYKTITSPFIKLQAATGSVSVLLPGVKKTTDPIIIAIKFHEAELNDITSINNYPVNKKYVDDTVNEIVEVLNLRQYQGSISLNFDITVTPQDELYQKIMDVLGSSGYNDVDNFNYEKVNRKLKISGLSKSDVLADGDHDIVVFSPEHSFNHTCGDCHYKTVTSPILNLGLATGSISFIIPGDRTLEHGGTEDITIAFRFFANNAQNPYSIDNYPVNKKYVDNAIPSGFDYEIDAREVINYCNDYVDFTEIDSSTQAGEDLIEELNEIIEDTFDSNGNLKSLRISLEVLRYSYGYENYDKMKLYLSSIDDESKHNAMYLNTSSDLDVKDIRYNFTFGNNVLTIRYTKNYSGALQDYEEHWYYKFSGFDYVIDGRINDLNISDLPTVETRITGELASRLTKFLFDEFLYELSDSTYNIHPTFRFAKKVALILSAYENDTCTLMLQSVTDMSQEYTESYYGFHYIFSFYDPCRSVIVYLYADNSDSCGVDSNWYIKKGYSFETEENKVQSISSSSGQTQYPSAKAVYDFVNDKTIQYSSMPTASSTLVDKIVQYIGTSTSTYKNGYFYKCTGSGSSYSWSQVDAQPDCEYVLPSLSIDTVTNADEATGELTSSTWTTLLNTIFNESWSTRTVKRIGIQFYDTSSNYRYFVVSSSFTDNSRINFYFTSFFGINYYFYIEKYSSGVNYSYRYRYFKLTTLSDIQDNEEIVDFGSMNPSLNSDITIASNTELFNTIISAFGRPYYHDYDSKEDAINNKKIMIDMHSSSLVNKPHEVVVFKPEHCFSHDCGNSYEKVLVSPVMNLGPATGTITVIIPGQYSEYTDIVVSFRFFSNNYTVGSSSSYYAIDNYPVNKKYVDDNISSLTGYEQTSNKVTNIGTYSTDTQYPSAKCVYDYIDDTTVLKIATLPTASADNLGKVYQFVGTTTSSYTNGYFYKCVSDGESTPTYSWEEYHVQSPAPMYIMSYGHSTWSDFITAYQKRLLVYCRASSNSNPATGSQTRMAFMAYVNNADNPTEVEFQYYRSVSTHTASQQGDQVYVYKLTNASGGTWTVTTRQTGPKVVAGTNMTSSYSNDILTLNATQPTDYLSTSNTTAYTPTGDYHPATKKYVDDTIPKIINLGTVTFTDSGGGTYMYTCSSSVDSTNYNALVGLETNDIVQLTSSGTLLDGSYEFSMVGKAGDSTTTYRSSYINMLLATINFVVTHDIANSTVYVYLIQSAINI